MSKALELFEQPIPLTGPCKLKREAVNDISFAGHQIVQSGGEFRMHGVDLRATLSPDDALWIIDKLMLGAGNHGIMRRVVIWSQE